MTAQDNAICIDCGLCCNGTMFHAIDLDPSDDVRVLLTRGAVMVTDAQSKRFHQPCPGFDGSHCLVYESRPSACRSFTCSLLTSVTSGRTSPDEARSIIARTRELADALEIDFQSDSDSSVVHLGQHGMSTYLGIMASRYDPEHLTEVFPEAAELIDILRTSFGWTSRTAAGD